MKMNVCRGLLYILFHLRLSNRGHKETNAAWSSRRYSALKSVVICSLGTLNINGGSKVTKPGEVKRSHWVRISNLPHIVSNTHQKFHRRPPMFTMKTPSSLEPYQDIFYAVILYDTIDSAKRGMGVLSKLRDILNDGLFEIRPCPWRMDFMLDPTTFEGAIHDIRKAHTIIISTSGMTPLPVSFKVWIHSLLDLRSGDNVAVIALLGQDDSSQRKAARDRLFLKQQAVDANLAFFADIECFGETPKTQVNEPIVDSASAFAA